eukprot:3934377-Rhodomonas_salina.1
MPGLMHAVLLLMATSAICTSAFTGWKTNVQSGLQVALPFTVPPVNSATSLRARYQMSGTDASTYAVCGTELATELAYGATSPQHRRTRMGRSAALACAGSSQ